MILVNGAELKRVVGYNFLMLGEHLNQATELHYRDYDYIGNSGETWERFYDAFDRFA